MANNPITTPLPADLPTNWTYGQTIGASGTDVGLTAQHGYNYLMQQVNAAQQAATQIGQAFSGLPSLGSDGKIPATQLPAMNYDPAGSAATVQTNLTNHINNKSNPHGVTAEQLNALGLTMNTYANLDDMPEKLLIALTNKDGVSGLPDGWPQNRNAFIRFFTGNIAYSLDLLANYANKKLAYRFAKDQWASLVTEAELAGKAEVHLFSYMGTGTYEGDINAGGVSVTADKPILMVGVLMRKENSTGEFYPTTSTRSSDNNANTIILTSPLTTEYTEGTGLGDPYGSTTNAKLYAKKSLDGKTVYWTCRYSTSYYGGRYGFAEEGYTYYGFYIC